MNPIFLHVQHFFKQIGCGSYIFNKRSEIDCGGFNHVVEYSFCKFNFIWVEFVKGNFTNLSFPANFFD